MNTSNATEAENISRWDLFTTTWAMLLAVFLPLEQMAYHADYTHPVLFGVRWLGYFVFGLDVYFRFSRDEYRHRLVGRKWMTFDLLAALPLGPVLFRTWESAPGWLLVAVHLLPMLRLVRVYITARHWQQMNPTLTGFRRIATTFLFIALATHWIGCWQMAVYEQDPADSISMRYLQSIYWTVTTMTTIGYGDITPDKHQADDLLFTMLIMAIGALSFGFIIGNVATIMSNLDFARNQHLDKMQRINTFMLYNEIPRKLRERVHSYYSYLWQTRRGFDESSVISELPPALRNDMEMHLRRDIVAKVPIFRGADNNLLRALVAQLKPRIALPEELIIRKGEIGESMFFIASGSVEVLGPDDTTPVATLTEGSFFGEIALLERCPRGAHVRATGYCDLYTLDKSALDYVIDLYPDFGAHIREMADKRKSGK